MIKYQTNWRNAKLYTDNDIVNEINWRNAKIYDCLSENYKVTLKSMNEIDITKLFEIFRKYGITSVTPIDYQEFVNEIVDLKKETN